MISADSIIEQTVARFPSFTRGQIAVEPVEKGGSDRRFYRIAIEGAPSLILVKYGNEKGENGHYVRIARFLHSVGVNVPEIYVHDAGEGLIWMEDLGEIDLYSFKEEPWADRHPLYEKTLDQMFQLHTQAHLALPQSDLVLQAEFNRELYLWEQRYFIENCLHRHFELDPELVEAECDPDALARHADHLATLPRVLVHRDFQSQNVLVRGGEAFLIDFQGLRPGLAQYDLASLLMDPYAELTRRQIEECFSYYVDRCIDAGMELPVDFVRTFELCAVQRLMQALGAYGYLGHVKQRSHFLGYIPVAMRSLRQMCERISDLPNLTRVLNTLT